MTDSHPRRHVYLAVDTFPFTIVAMPQSHYCDFVCYEIVGFDSSRPDVIYYQKSDSDFSPDSVDGIDEAQVFLHGSIKWDSCANLHFDAQDDAMLHFCSRNDAAKVGLLFNRLYDLAADLIEHWDISLADVKN